MDQLVCDFTIKGIAPIAFGKAFTSKPKKGEKHDAFDERCWRERMHTNQDGDVIISAFAIKNCISESAKFLGEKIPGKGNTTYTKHFEAGVLCVDDPILCNGNGKAIPGEKVAPYVMFVPADGMRGGSKRVHKTFPVIHPPWSAKVQIHVLSPMLVQDSEVVERYVRQAGMFIGLGSFRVRNNGIFGRFEVEGFKVAR